MKSIIWGIATVCSVVAWAAPRPLSGPITTETTAQALTIQWNQQSGRIAVNGVIPNTVSFRSVKVDQAASLGGSVIINETLVINGTTVSAKTPYSTINSAIERDDFGGFALGNLSAAQLNSSFVIADTVMYSTDLSLDILNGTLTTASQASVDNLNADTINTQTFTGVDNLDILGEIVVVNSQGADPLGANSGFIIERDGGQGFVTTDSQGVSWLLQAPLGINTISITPDNLMTGPFIRTFGTNSLTGSQVPGNYFLPESISNQNLATIDAPGMVQNSALSATSAAVAGEILLRDAFGGFQAGSVTSDILDTPIAVIDSNLNGTTTPVAAAHSLVPFSQHTLPSGEGGGPIFYAIDRLVYQLVSLSGQPSNYVTRAVYDTSTGTPVGVSFSSLPNNVTQLVVSGGRVFGASAGINPPLIGIGIPADVGIPDIQLHFTNPSFFFTVDGDYTYAISPTNSAFEITAFAGTHSSNYVKVNLTYPADPVSCAVSQGYFYITMTDPFHEGLDSRLIIYDVSSPLQPTLKSAHVLSTSTAENMAVQGGYAYIFTTTNGQGAITVVDVHNPSSPTVVATIDMPIATTLCGNILPVEDRLYVAGSDGTAHSYLFAYDISNPTAPVLFGSFTYPGAVQLPNALIVGSWLYFYTRDDNTLSIFNVGLSGAHMELDTLVAGQLTARGDTLVQNNLSVQDSAFAAMGLLAAGSTAFNGNLGVNATYYNPYYTLNTYGLAVYGNSSAPAMKVTSYGSQAPVQVGFSDYSASVAATLVLDTSGNVLYEVSNERAKRNIEPISTRKAYEDIGALRPVVYDLTLAAGGVQQQYGFIAEEVAETIPEAVNGDSAGNPFSLHYPSLAATLCASLTEHRARLAALAAHD